MAQLYILFSKTVNGYKILIEHLPLTQQTGEREREREREREKERERKRESSKIRSCQKGNMYEGSIKCGIKKKTSVQHKKMLVILSPCSKTQHSPSLLIQSKQQQKHADLGSRDLMTKWMML